MRKIKSILGNARSMKWICASLCVAGLVVSIVMKKAFRLPNGVCLLASSMFFAAGLLGYFLFDKKGKRGAHVDEADIMLFLESTLASLRSGHAMSDALDNAKDKVGGVERKRDIDSFLDDGTGPLINSRHRHLLDLLRQARNDERTQCIQSLIQCEVDGGRTSWDCRLGYLALGSFVVELMAIVICVFLSAI